MIIMKKLEANNSKIVNINNGIDYSNDKLS